MANGVFADMHHEVAIEASAMQALAMERIQEVFHHDLPNGQTDWRLVLDKVHESENNVVLRQQLNRQLASVFPEIIQQVLGAKK